MLHLSFEFGYDLLYANDVVYIQKPILPEGFEIDALSVNGTAVTSFPYRLCLQKKLALELTIKQVLHRVTLSTDAEKYLRVVSEEGVAISNGSEVLDRTKCQIDYVGKEAEYLKKLTINGEVFFLSSLPLVFCITKDLQIDVEVEVVRYKLSLDFPPTCSVFIGEEEVKFSPYEYVGTRGEALNIRVLPEERYYVKGYSLNGERFLGSELTLPLKVDTKLSFDVFPKRVAIATHIEGNGRLLVETSNNGEHKAGLCFVNSGDSVRITPIPASGYFCEHVTIDGRSQELQDEITFMPLTDSEIQAVFKVIPLVHHQDGYIFSPVTHEVVGGKRGVTALTINAPEPLTIAPQAFKGNVELETLCIEEGISKVGTSAFEKTNLRTVYLGRCVDSIGDRAFALCKKLSLVEVEHPNPSDLHLGVSSFPKRSARKQILLRVPRGSGSLYSSDPRFKNFLIVENKVSCVFGGSVFNEDRTFAIQSAEHGEGEWNTKQYRKGEELLPGGVTLNFTKKGNKENIELVINGVVQDLPCTYKLLSPSVIKINVFSNNGDDNNGNNGGKSPTPVGIEESYAQRKEMFSPNPASEYIRVGFADGEALPYQLISMQGKIVQEGILPVDGIIDIRHLSSGVYIVHLLRDGRQYNAKLVKL